jgi:hypothetical protein
MSIFDLSIDAQASEQRSYRDIDPGAVLATDGFYKGL